MILLSYSKSYNSYLILNKFTYKYTYIYINLHFIYLL